MVPYVLPVAGIYFNFDLFRGLHRDVYQGFVLECPSSVLGVLCSFVLHVVLFSVGKLQFYW